MEITNNENEIRLLVQFDESSPVLVVNSEGVKPNVSAFEGLKVQGRMVGIGEKQGFLFFKLFRKPEFLNLFTGLFGEFYLHTAEAQTWRQSCQQLPCQDTRLRAVRF